MCRFLAYKGTPALMADLLIRSENSLLVQSYDAKTYNNTLNGDGFGVAWYPLHDDPIPGIYKNILPAWVDLNIRSLSEKIYASCFFAHVRDATPGTTVTELNCHPFRFKQFTFMHNGHIAKFMQMKRKLRAVLSDELYNFIKGNTDSEHIFALWLHFLKNRETPELTDIETAINKTLRQIARWNQDDGVKEPTYINLAITDGLQMVATRYSSIPEAEAATLFVSSGIYQHHADSNEVRVHDTMQTNKETVIIASEPLTAWQEDWEKVEQNSIITVNQDNQLKISTLTP